MKSSLKKVPLSAIFYALGDPVRLKILLTLIENSELSCGECHAPVSKSTMSHHFKVLRETGLIRKREAGKTHYLSLQLQEIEARLPGFLDVLKNSGEPL